MFSAIFFFFWGGCSKYLHPNGSPKIEGLQAFEIKVNLDQGQLAKTQRLHRKYVYLCSFTSLYDLGQKLQLNTIKACDH